MGKGGEAAAGMSATLEGDAEKAAEALQESAKLMDDDVQELIEARRIADEARKAAALANAAVASADLRVAQALAKVQNRAHVIEEEASSVTQASSKAE